MTFTVKHLKWFERFSFIFYRKRRYMCASCGKRFYENNPIVNRYKRFSKEWDKAVRVRSIKAKTFKELGQQFDASTSTVMRRFDEMAKKELKNVQQLPRVIAIDEYKGDTKAGKYQLIIADGETREPIDILPNRRKKTISNYLREYGENVEIVIMDMSQSFKAAVKEALGKPVIVADRFHFCRYIYWALDGVRRRVQASWDEYDRKKCKKKRYIFYKDSTKLTDEERWWLNRYCQMSEELHTAYRLKEEFCRWFEQAKRNGAENICKSKEGLYRFYHLVERAGIPEFIKNIETLKRWQVEILNVSPNYKNKKAHLPMRTSNSRI